MYPVTFYPAVARTGVAVATVIALGSAPVFAGLLSWITGQARPTARWTAATAAAVLGCTLPVGPELTGHATPTGGVTVRQYLAPRVVTMPVGSTYWTIAIKGAQP